MTRQIILQPLHVCSYLIYKSFLSLGAGILKPNTAFLLHSLSWTSHICFKKKPCQEIQREYINAHNVK